MVVRNAFMAFLIRIIYPFCYLVILLTAPVTRFPALVYCSVADVHVRIQVSQACWLLAVGGEGASWQWPADVCGRVEVNLSSQVHSVWNLGETGVFLSWRECLLLVGTGPLHHLHRRVFELAYPFPFMFTHFPMLRGHPMCPLVYILTRAGRLSQSKLICHSFSFLIVCYSFYLLMDMMGLVGWVQYSLLHRRERAPVSFWGDLPLANGLFYLVYFNPTLLF